MIYHHGKGVTIFWWINENNHYFCRQDMLCDLKWKFKSNYEIRWRLSKVKKKTISCLHTFKRTSEIIGSSVFVKRKGVYFSYQQNMLFSNYLGPVKPSYNLTLQQESINTTAVTRFFAVVAYCWKISAARAGDKEGYAILYPVINIQRQPQGGTKRIKPRGTHTSHTQAALSVLIHSWSHPKLRFWSCI